MNVFDWFALPLLVYALSVRLFMSDSSSAQPALGVGLGLHVLAGLMRLLLFFEDWGPFVLVFYSMVRDCAKWAVLLLVFVASFASALRVASKGPADKCGESANAYGLAGLLLKMVELVFDTGLAGLEDDDGDNCFFVGSFPVTGVLMLTYLLFVVVVLLNMLISMMSNTYTDIVGQSTLHYRVLHTRGMLLLKKMEPTPPPLSLLVHLWSLARGAVRGLLWILRRCTTAGKPTVGKPTVGYPTVEYVEKLKKRRRELASPPPSPPPSPTDRYALLEEGHYAEDDVSLERLAVRRPPSGHPLALPSPPCSCLRSPALHLRLPPRSQKHTALSAVHRLVECLCLKQPRTEARAVRSLKRTIRRGSSTSSLRNGLKQKRSMQNTKERHQT